MSRLEEQKEIELRSEEVQDIMGRIPSWIERWGITIIFAVTVLLLAGSYLFRYPETIVAEMILTGHEPAVPIVARCSGRLTGLRVTEGMEVEAGTVLATIENPASETDMDKLTRLLRRYGECPDSLYNRLTTHKGGWVLGEVQSAYAAFLNRLYETENYNRMSYFPKKRETLRSRISQYQKHREGSRNQLKIAEQQYELAQRGHERQVSLYANKMISPADYEQSESRLLSSRSAWEAARSALEQMDIQIGQMEENLLDLTLEQTEKETVLRQNYQSALEQLQNALESWALTYRITSPISGRVTFTDYWSDNQTVQAGGEVFYIVPASEERLIGRAKLPVSRSGKVRSGQRAIVSFTNYPENEYGVVNGVVESISLVPSASFYTVEIAFPQGLYTTYRQTLPPLHEMAATARIVTDDARLIEQLVMPIKSFINNNQQIEKCTE